MTVEGEGGDWEVLSTFKDVEQENLKNQRQMEQPRLTDIPEPFLFLYISEPCCNCEKALSASQH